MKFSDIKTFMKSGNYEVDIDITRLESNLEAYSENYGLELNPDFQRGHVWTESQQISFIEFFFRGGRTSRVIYFNSPAFGGPHEDQIKDLDDTLLCVDGLQRLTSLLRFVRNEIPLFGHYYKDFEDRPRITQSIKFNINGLKTRREVLQWYLEMNSGGTVHTEDELSRVRNLLVKESN